MLQRKNEEMLKDLEAVARCLLVDAALFVSGFTCQPTDPTDPNTYKNTIEQKKPSDIVYLM